MRGALASVAVSVLAGVAAGIGGYTFVYAKGASYLGNDPATCANCHVMQGHLDGWQKGSHHGAATCNDCHTPAGFAGKYFTKGLNGFNHSFAFTTGRFHEPIEIKPRNRAVLEGQCRHCHAEIAAAIDGPYGPGEPISCVRCHRTVGHL